MELKEIIKSDKDRLFVLDDECFIIYTADDLADEKPFIRIGNWIDLPSESIPLIENIIVTDSITGNPAHEQFNIDPEFLTTNRYIGSRQVIQNYLDFQKNFGLDLTNVSVVDVEKDLPYLSKEQSISSKDSFLGIFYTNGNFRVVYKDNTLFDLKEYENKSPVCIKEHDLVSNNNKDSVKYSGSGIILLSNNILFYKNRYFTSYQFPNKYLDDFKYLNIDPAKIRELILPASNVTDITNFLKWCNSKKTLLKIFSNFKNALLPMQKLFPDVSLKLEDFHGHSFDTGDGLTVQNYPGSLNEKIIYRNTSPSLKKLELAYLKEYAGIREILKEKLDGIIVPFTIYEQASVYFNSTYAPVVCADDGNKNISKLKGKNIIILNQNVKYEFYKFEEDVLIENAAKILAEKDIIEFISIKNIEEIKKILFNNFHLKENLEFNDIKDFLNIISILRIVLNTTRDRKFFADIQKVLQKALSLFDKEEIIQKEADTIKISLYFYDYSIYEFYENIEIKNKTNSEPDNFFGKRIQIDRIRFLELLELYKISHSKTKKDFAFLNSEIDRRKKIYNTAENYLDRKELRKGLLKLRLGKLKKVFKVIVIIIIIALLSLLSVNGFNYYMKYRETVKAEKEKQEKEATQRVRIEKEKNEKIELIEKYQIHVSDHDIYIYANKVARKNGYREIEYKDLKEKNPNWIFPGNIFYLIDGEKVLVKKGDTLWDISDNKLMGIQVEFYKLIDKIEGSKSKAEKTDMLNKAQDIAFSKKHFTKIEEIKKVINK
jgi:hypothetical protein